MGTSTGSSGPASALVLAGDLEARVAHFCDEFVALAGHDLRNPLSAIINSAELVRMLGGPDAERAADRILRTAGRLARMIDQMLDVSRIQLGRGVLVRATDGDLGAVVRQVVRDLTEARPRARIEVVAVDAVPAWFDADRVAPLVAGLIGNALDHGAADAAVRVTIDRAPTATPLAAAAPDPVCLRVENRGGMAPEVLRVALDPMRHGRKKGPRSGAMGLGLFVATHVASAHGGRLEVTSDEATTRVALYLPRTSPALVRDPA